MTSPISCCIGPALAATNPPQRENLIWVGDGMKEIARRLGMSPGTVKLHVRSIFNKTGARSRYALVAQMAVRSAA